jgi:uncharacterized protein (DUF1330 family)
MSQKSTLLVTAVPNADEMALVVDFESSDAITALFASDDYAALVSARDRGLSEINIFVTDEM